MSGSGMLCRVPPYGNRRGLLVESCGRVRFSLFWSVSVAPQGGVFSRGAPCHSPWERLESGWRGGERKSPEGERDGRSGWEENTFLGKLPSGARSRNETEGTGRGPLETPGVY